MRSEQPPLVCRFCHGRNVPPSRVEGVRFEQELLDHLRHNGSVLQNIRETKSFDDDTAQALREQIAEFKRGFQTGSGKMLAGPGREEHETLDEGEVEQEQIVRQRRR